jgi:hypothetical protein
MASKFSSNQAPKIGIIFQEITVLDNKLQVKEMYIQGKTHQEKNDLPGIGEVVVRNQF